MARTSQSPTTRRSRAERQPLMTAFEFVRLCLMYDAASHSPMRMLLEPIAVNLDDDELHALLRQLDRTTLIFEEELAGRHAQRRLQ